MKVVLHKLAEDSGELLRLKKTLLSGMWSSQYHDGMDNARAAVLGMQWFNTAHGRDRPQQFFEGI